MAGAMKYKIKIQVEILVKVIHYVNFSKNILYHRIYNIFTVLNWTLCYLQIRFYGIRQTAM